MNQVNPSLVALGRVVVSACDVDHTAQAIFVAEEMLTLSLAGLRQQHGRHIPGCTMIALGQVVEAIADSLADSTGSPPAERAPLHRAAIDAAHKAAERIKARSRTQRHPGALGFTPTRRTPSSLPAF